MTDIAPHIVPDLQEILTGIIKDFKVNEIVDAIILTGSYARGDFTEYSDVDITVFYDNLGSIEYPPYDLNYNSNYLISISKSTINLWREKLVTSQELFAIRFAIKDAIILYDRTDSFRKVQTELESDPWQQIKEKRFREINYETRGYVEEVYKLMEGIKENNESLISFALTGLIIGITKIISMHLELLISTENQLYIDLQSTVGYDSKWSELFRKCLGIGKQMDVGIMERGQSGLKLFLETLSFISLYNETANFVKIPIHKISQILSS